MTHHIDAIRDDLAFMRGLASADEPGASRKGGVLLTAAGIIFGAASLVAWRAASGALPAAAVVWVWPVATGVYIGVLASTLVLFERSQGVRDRAAGVAWAGVGGAIFAILLGLQAAAATAHSPVVLAAIPTVVLALYGAGWTVAAAMSGRRWKAATAFASYAAAVAIGFLVASPSVFLAYAAALLLLAAAPGVFILLRRG